MTITDGAIRVIDDKQFEILQHLDELHLLIEKLFSANKPGGWSPLYVNLNVIQPQLIMGPNDRRGGFALVNYGPSAILIADSQFDANDILAQYNEGDNSVALPVAYVPANGSISIDTKGALYALNVSNNAILSIIQSLYDVPMVPQGGNVNDGDLFTARNIKGNVFSGNPA